MNNKQRFDFFQKQGLFIHVSDIDRITTLVNRLIVALYIPCQKDDIEFKLDSKRIKYFKIDQEPINWGDLKCNEVKKFDDGSYLVVIDEASPDGCPTFCSYIEKYMTSWGWSVKVETEW